jgi:D-sedoheptulose 7-phosphate isomerase
MTKDFFDHYIEEEQRLLGEVSEAEFNKVIDFFQTAYDESRQVFVFGNGGSGSTASHFACDINKGVSCGLDKRFKVICLNDNIPTMLAYANDCSYDDIFVEQLKNFMQPGDLVFGISGSGNSENVLRAIEHANNNGAKTIGFTGFEGGRLGKAAGLSINVATDDMQKIEDIHLILTHMIMQAFCKKLGIAGKKDGEKS